MHARGWRGEGGSFWWEDILLFFGWWGCRPQPHITKNLMAQKCSQPIRLLDSFTKNFSRNAWSFQFIVFLHGSSASWLKSMKYLLVADPFWSSLWESHKSALFFKIQNWLLAFVFLFTNSKIQGFLTDINLLIISLLEKHINHVSQQRI